MCSGAAGFLINSRASVAAYLSVKLLCKSIGRQKEKSKEIEIVANVGGKYQREKKVKIQFPFNDLLSGIGVFLLRNS